MSNTGKFRVRPDVELGAMDSDELVAYIRDSRDAGELAATRSAVTILAWGLLPSITARMRMRVPPQHADEVALEAFEKAAKGAFRGESIGEFQAWLNAIIKGTANDWLRRWYKRQDLVEAQSLDREGGPEPIAVSESGAVELRLLTDEVLAEMNEQHRIVIELHVFEGLTAPEVCDRVDGMQPDNVAKIASRFRKRMREALDDGT